LLSLLTSMLGHSPFRCARQQGRLMGRQNTEHLNLHLSKERLLNQVGGWATPGMQGPDAWVSIWPRNSGPCQVRPYCLPRHSSLVLAVCIVVHRGSSARPPFVLCGGDESATAWCALAGCCRNETAMDPGWAIVWAGAFIFRQCGDDTEAGNREIRDLPGLLEMSVCARVMVPGGRW